MNTHMHTYKLSTAHSYHTTLATEGTRLWGHRIWEESRSRWLFSAISAALVVSLLLAFYNVVRQVVYQSAVQQRALVVHTRDTWRCKLLPGDSARQACLMAIPKLLANGDRTIAPVSP